MFKLTQIKLKNQEEAYDWISNNLAQGDARYEPWEEERDWLTYFILNKAIIIEEREIPNLQESTYEEIRQIDGPQQNEKFIAIKLLELNGFDTEKIKTEYRLSGKRADVFARLGRRKVLVECCSLYTNKVIRYLEELNAELWVITSNDKPPNHSKWFIENFA